METNQEQSKPNNVVFVVKISGPTKDFIDDIVSTLKNAYTIPIASKPLPNDKDAGFHVFLTIIRGCKPWLSKFGSAGNARNAKLSFLVIVLLVIGVLNAVHLILR